MVRYTLKPRRAGENEDYIRRVFAQLARELPAGLRYAVFKLDDGLSFVHIAESDGRYPLTELSAFQAFIAGIRERCAEPPVTVQLQEIGSYGYFDAVTTR
jgi:hypothetical protein